MGKRTLYERLRAEVKKYNQEVVKIGRRLPATKGLIRKEVAQEYKGLSDEAIRQAIKRMRSIKNRDYFGILTRLSENDEKRLRNAINNYNARRREIIKNNPELEASLPKRNFNVEKKQLRTTKDITDLVARLNRFSRSRNERTVNINGITMLESQYRQTVADTNRINAERERMRASLDIETGSGLMRAAREIELRPRKQLSERTIRGRQELRYELGAIERLARESTPEINSIRYKENYIRAIRNRFSRSQASRVINMIRDIDPSELVEFSVNDVYLTFDWIYDINELEIRFSKYIDSLEDYLFNRG